MFNGGLIYFLLHRRKKKATESHDNCHGHAHSQSKKPFAGMEFVAWLTIIAIGALFVTSFTSAPVGFVAGIVALVILMAMM